MRKKRATLSPSDEIRALHDTAYREHSALLYSMHELSRLISTRIDKAMAAHRLTHAQWWGLMHIFEHEGATQSELAEILQLGRASTGKLLERLEAKHWIERRPDAGDSRVRRIFLSHDVVPVFRLMTEEGQRLFKVYLEDISPAEEARLVRGLMKLRANAERHSAHRPARRRPRTS